MSPEFTVEYLDPATLAPHPRNFRRHPAPQKAALESSISEHGWLAAPILNKRSGNLVDGHARVELAREAGEASIPVRVIDVSPAQERRILAQFDQIGELRERDDGALASLLQELAESEAGLPAGWGDEDLAGLLAGLEPESGLQPGVDPDAIPELVETRCQAGDLWQLGAHRLLCGDSTKADDVERLMGRGRVDVLITSPPYNQYIDQFRPSGMYREGNWVSKVKRLAYRDSLPEETYQQVQRDLLDAWHSLLPDDASIFYNHKNRYREKALISPLAWLPGPFTLRQEIVWSRHGSVTQNARMFMPSDERIYWMYKGGDFYFDDSTEIKSYSTVWSIAPSINLDHAVAFPVELPTRCIMACSRPTGVIYDPFAGSGTTLIACEQTGRSARCLEIEPRCCDTILARWEAGTGKTAERIE